MAKSKELSVCPTFNVTIAGKEFVLDFNKVSLQDAWDMGDDLGGIRADFHDMKDSPMEPEETFEAWQKRCGIEIDERFMMRKATESADEHLKRINTPKFQNYNVAFLFLCKLCARFSMPEVTFAEFKSCKWGEVRAFLHNVCQEAEIGAPEFFPKSVIRA